MIGIDVIIGILAAAATAAFTYFKVAAVKRANRISADEAIELSIQLIVAVRDGKITQEEATELLKSAWEAQKK